MKIIITGASGFVGTNLSRYLRDKGNGVQELSLRMNDWVLNKDADALIHLAGKAHDTAHTSTEEEYFKINTDLTIRLFDIFLSSDIRDFFYFSSVKATADSVHHILDENHQSDPKTPYGKSKLQAEEYLLSKVLPAGRRLFVIRPCMIHGPGNKGNLNLLYQVVKMGLPWPLAAFENQRSFLSMDNLSFLIQNMIQNEVPSGIYNFADDDPLSTNQLVKIIGKSSGKKEKLWKISPAFITRIVAIGDTLKLPLNTERLKKLTESYKVSNNKIKSALGIQNLPVSAVEGMEKTIRSFNKKEK